MRKDDVPTPDTSAKTAGLLERIKRFTGIDRAIFFTIIARSWGAFAGVISVMLIARFLTPAEQGYYYTFASLVAIQIVFELGFSFVILQMATHERALLKKCDNTGIEGDPVVHARLASVLQKAVRWYTYAAMVMAAVLIPVGIHFFTTHSHPGDHVSWMAPWCLDAIAAVVTFQIDPVISFLTGCGFVPQVAKMRFWQAIAASVLAWSAMLLHHGLYAPAMTLCGQAGVGIYFLVVKYGKLLGGLLRLPQNGHGISWKKEIWPFQWRVAISWASSYFVFQFFNPVLFAFRGPAEAGKMGMSLNISQALSNVALAWIATKAAPFGGLVATKQIAKLDQIFRKTVIQSTAVLFLGGLATIGGLYIAFSFVPRMAQRILPLPVFAVLMLCIVLRHVVSCQSYYLRAHKQEPFLIYWVVISLLSMVSVLYTGKYWGAIGVTFAYFIVGSLLRLVISTYVFFKKRREWHGDTAQDAEMSADSRPKEGTEEQWDETADAEFASESNAINQIQN